MADYDYSNKYIFLQPFRRDGTSRFLDRWGNFWSVGAAWRISNEAFMEGTNSWLNDLKLRASYGTQGKSILSSMTMPMCTMPLSRPIHSYLEWFRVGYSPEFYGNPDLTWEKQKTLTWGRFPSIRQSIRFIRIFLSSYRRYAFKRPVAYSSTAGRPYNWENLGAMKTLV